MDRWYAIADAVVLVFGLLLMAGIIGVMLAMAFIVFIKGGMAVGLAALVPAAVLLVGATGAFCSWYRTL